jgi:NADPH:quinone reductase-like Zn-dependent oxidoreductase
MKAVLWTGYGPPEVLQYGELETPTPKDDEVLIKIRATKVTAGDCEAQSLQFPFFLSPSMRLYVGFSRPTRVQIIGQELAGEIEAVGKDVRSLKSGQTYDLIFDVVGKGSYSDCLRSLNEKGRYLITNPKVSHMIRGRWTSATSSKQVITKYATRKGRDLVFLKKLIETGKIRTVIDRRFPLEQTAEVHRYVEAGGKLGNVIINVVG